MLKQTLVAVVATAVAMGAALSATAKEGRVIEPNTLGAALAMPYLTSTEDGGDRMTVASVTNTLDSRAVSLHLNWISGTDWSAIDYDCPLTPLETTYFVHEKMAGSDNALVTFECSDNGQEFPNAAATNNVVTRVVNGADGILFVTIECQLGAENCETRNQDGGISRTRNDNALAGDIAVIDFGAGFAFSAPAIHIQGVFSQEFDNRNYDFTGEGGEYRQFPSLLTTNYIAPDDSVTAELVLFTLDGTVGAGSAAAKLSGFAYDDDENPTSGSISFDCLTVTAIDASPNGFGLNVTRPFGGHLVGHLELFPAAVARSDIHELKNGESDGVRRALVHGYLVQTIGAGGQFDGGEFGGTMATNAAWARQLTQGTNALVRIGDDTPSLDTRVDPEESL